MSSDREAFIAGIAADPENDLRRLVFADWLEENGEPERAEFVRLQIEGRHLTDPAALKPLDARAGELFLTNGPAWFGPFLLALDPQRTDFVENYSFNGGGARNCAIEGPRITPPLPAYYRAAAVRRGFVNFLILDLAGFPPGSSVTTAFAQEPVTRLSTTMTADRHQWKRFSEPALRHVTTLSVAEVSAGGPLVAAPAVFADYHLPAVRAFTLRVRNRDAQPRRLATVPPATMQAFVDSPLAYRVNDLNLTLDDAGLRALCRSDWLRLDTLTVTGSLTRDGVRHLNAAGFAPTLRTLNLTAGLTDDAVAVLAEGTHFRKLAELNLEGNSLTDAGFRALAAARFAPQLEVLELWENAEEFAHELPPGLRALADALNPDTLRRLRVSMSSYAEVPAYLTARFGDRVTVR